MNWEWFYCPHHSSTWIWSSSWILWWFLQRSC